MLKQVTDVTMCAMIFFQYDMKVASPPQEAAQAEQKESQNFRAPVGSSGESISSPHRGGHNSRDWEGVGIGQK